MCGAHIVTAAWLGALVSRATPDAPWPHESVFLPLLKDEESRVVPLAEYNGLSSPTPSASSSVGGSATASALRPRHGRTASGWDGRSVWWHAVPAPMPDRPARVFPRNLTVVLEVCSPLLAVLREAGVRAFALSPGEVTEGWTEAVALTAAEGLREAWAAEAGAGLVPGVLVCTEEGRPALSPALAALRASLVAKPAGGGLGFALMFENTVLHAIVAARSVLEVVEDLATGPSSIAPVTQALAAAAPAPAPVSAPVPAAPAPASQTARKRERVEEHVEPAAAAAAPEREAKRGKKEEELPAAPFISSTVILQEHEANKDAMEVVEAPRGKVAPVAAAASQGREATVAQAAAPVAKAKAQATPPPAPAPAPLPAVPPAPAPAPTAPRPTVSDWFNVAPPVVEAPARAVAASPAPSAGATPAAPAAEGEQGGMIKDEKGLAEEEGPPEVVEARRRAAAQAHADSLAPLTADGWRDMSQAHGRARRVAPAVAPGASAPASLLSGEAAAAPRLEPGCEGLPFAPSIPTDEYYTGAAAGAGGPATPYALPVPRDLEQYYGGGGWPARGKRFVKVRPLVFRGAEEEAEAAAAVSYAEDEVSGVDPKLAAEMAAKRTAKAEAEKEDEALMRMGGKARGQSVARRAMPPPPTVPPAFAGFLQSQPAAQAQAGATQGGGAQRAVSQSVSRRR